jgi:hypothetical protein
MSVIFQLFCADDLTQLAPEQLEALKMTVSHALNTDRDVLDSIKDRAYEVFRQLEQNRNPSQQLISTDASKGMLLQLFSEADLHGLTAQDLDILKMAIICEITHSPAALQVVQTKAYALFTMYTGRQPGGSDAFYQHIP